MTTRESGGPGGPDDSWSAERFPEGLPIIEADRFDQEPTSEEKLDLLKVLEKLIYEPRLDPRQRDIIRDKIKELQADVAKENQKMSDKVQIFRELNHRGELI